MNPRSTCSLVALALTVTVVGCGGGDAVPAGHDATARDSAAPADARRFDVSPSLTDAPGTDVARDTAAVDAGGTDAEAARPDAFLAPEVLIAADAFAPDAFVTPDAAPPRDGPNLACGFGITTPPIPGPSAAKTDGDQLFRSLTVDPTNPEIVYAGSEGNGLFRSRDGAKTWTWLRTGLRHDNHTAYGEVWDIAVAPSKPSVLYAAVLDSPGPVSGDYPSARGGVYRSDDQGDSWKQTSCGLPTSRVTTLTVSPTDHLKVVASFEGGKPSFGPTDLGNQFFPGGFWRTSDGGASWAAATAPSAITHNALYQLLRRGNDLYGYGNDSHDAQGTGLGFLVSHDEGATWTTLTSPVAGLNTFGWDVSADGQTILVNPRDAFKLKRSTNGGSTFADVTTLEIAPAGPLVISPDGGTLLYAGNNLIVRAPLATLSSAEKVFEAPAFVEEFVYAPSNPSIVYAAVRGLRIYRSDDGGKTWAARANLRADVIGVP